MPEVPKYEEFISPEPELPDDKMSQISVLVRRQLELEGALAQAEALVKQVKSGLYEVQSRQLPDLLEELGLSELTTAEGSKVKLDTTIRASLGKSKNPEKAAKAITWLEANSPHLVSHKLSVPLTAGQEDLANAVLKELEKVNARLSKRNDAWSIDVEDVKDVHSSRLAAWVRKKLEAGEEIPEDLFNVHRGREVKIKV